jgi:pyrrolysine biosynthesis protein PylC
VILIDRRPVVPAQGLADEFYQMDVTDEGSNLGSLLRKADLIIPAVEDPIAQSALKQAAGREGVPLAYDEASYEVSSSKIKSDRLFSELSIPAPRPWPPGDFPLIIKPAGSSGSRGVRKIASRSELDIFLAQRAPKGENWVIQEFLEGPSYSIEVFGRHGKFLSLQTTTIEVDAAYDCKRVLAPADISPPLNEEFGRLSRKIAEALNLHGIMDVEVILHQGKLKVLEIDARLPSQTPTVVYKSTGINMVELLFEVFVKNSLPDTVPIEKERAVIYEHIKVTPEAIEVAGEHVMAAAGPLRIRPDFFGTDEAITDYRTGKTRWAATLIFTDKSPEDAWAKRCATIESLKDYFGISVYQDPVP